MKIGKGILKTLIVTLFFMTSVNTFASDMLCSTASPEYSIVLNTINVTPGSDIGTILAESGPITKQITCGTLPNSRVAYSNAGSDIVDTSVFIQKHNISCKTISSGYDGIGIAWFNYNSSTQKWACASQQVLSRRVDSDATIDIIDEVYLVKTGKISPGTSYFNKEFTFDEAVNNSSTNYLPNYGRLYNIYLKGTITINAPFCIGDNVNFNDNFETKKALTSSYTTNSFTVLVRCTGYIENNSLVNFSINSSFGKFLSNYFATSIPNVGVSLQYKTNSMDSFSNLNITDNPKIPLTIYENTSSVQFKVTPYINGNDYNNLPITSDSLKLNLSLLTE